MPIARFQMPDGRVARFEVAEGTTPEQAETAFNEWKAGINSAVSPAPTSKSLVDKYVDWQKETLGSVLEPAAQIVTGIGASAAGGLAGLAAAPFVGVDRSADIIRKIQGTAYQPKTTAGKAVSGAIAYPFEKAAEGWKEIGGIAGEAIGGEQGRIAGESIGEVVVPTVATLAGYKPMVSGANAVAQVGKSAIQSRQAANASNAIEQTQRNLPKIEATKDMQRLGLVADPAEINPTLKNRALVGWAGSRKTDILAAEKNLPVVMDVLKREAGVSDVKLNIDTLKAARREISKPYEDVRAVGKLTDSTGVSNTLRAALPEEITGAEPAINRSRRILTRLADRVDAGEFTGNSAVNHIKYYRENASRIRRNANATEADIARANAFMDSANALESLIEGNLVDKAVLTNFRNARKALAQNFTVEEIINPRSGVPDLAKLNSGRLSDAPLTGDLAALRNIQANRPEAVAPISKYGEEITHVSRTSPSGSLGAAAGIPFGAPTTGGLIGAATGLFGGKYIRGKVLSPEYQAANLMPKLQSLESPVNIPKPGLQIAPQGPLPTPPQGVPPQTRGLLGFADDQPARQPTRVEAYDFPIEPRIGPLYNPSMPRPPSTPSVPYSGALPSEAAIIPPAIPAARPSPLPTLPSDMPGLPGERGGMLSLGGVAESARPLPALPPRSPILGLADDEAAVRVGEYSGQKGIDFPLRQEVLQRPEIVAATNSFISEANGLKSILDNKYIIDRGVKADARAKLTALEDEFMAGLKQMGIRSESEARNIMRRLYEYGGSTQLPIQRTFDPRGMLSGGQP